MDDLAHQCPLNHRKRKADHDDAKDSSTKDKQVPDHPSVVTDPSSNAPRQHWLTSETDVWASPTSPQVSSPLTSQLVLTPSSSHKRPRIDTLDSTLRVSDKRYQRRSPSKMSPPRLASGRQGNDLQDIGIVSSADPGPSSGSLLRERSSPLSLHPSERSPQAPTSIIDFHSSYIPAIQPLINRQTLKELELDAIFRNPQLRHDLLFDSNLQFRPRRKREPTEKYWNALWQEIQTGCTCVSFDIHKKPRPVVCVCQQIPSTPTSPIVSRPSPDVYTLRMPSRVPPLLAEFLEVLLLVIQPLSTISGVYVNASSIKEQMEEHAAQASYIRTIFDPALIEQELKHKIFDPTGLFSAIGETLKRHCAPMRDRAVEEMVQAAHRPGPDAFKAVRSCLELLELMKLDIANHQLNQLRPLLIRTSSQFELKIFKNRFGGELSLHNTREWIHNAYESLLTRKRPILVGKDEISYERLPRNTQIYTAVLKGIVDAIFDNSNVSQPSTPSNSPPASPVTPSSSSPLSIPETLYLDKSRLSLLSLDASDITALYMFILLFRQLAHLESPNAASSSDAPKIDETVLSTLKREIRNIGPSHLGACFLAATPRNGCGDRPLSPQERKEVDQFRTAKQDVILQVAKRAHDVRYRKKGEDVCIDSATTSTSHLGTAPDQAVLGVAERWADSHMCRGAPLTGLLHNRMRDVLFDAVVALALPPCDSPAARWFKGDFLGNIQLPCFFSQTELNMPGAVGMEPLADEIRRLAEKIARLSLIHLNAYVSLYEADGFLQTRSPSSPSST